MARKDKDLQVVVAERAAELGQNVEPRDVRIDRLEGDPVPGVEVFRGIYQFRDMRGAVTGIVVGGEIETRPYAAVRRVLARWVEEDGALPRPETVAEVTGYLLAGAGPHQVVLTEDDADEVVKEPEQRALVTLPEAVEVDGEPGVTYWWLLRNQVSRVKLYLVDDGADVEVEQERISDVLGGG